MTAIKADNYAVPQPSFVDGRGAILHGTRTVAANPTATDTIDLILVPAGTEVCALMLSATDMDTDGTPEFAFKCGYRKANADDTLTADDDYWVLTGGTLLGTGGVLWCNAKPIKFEVDTIIELTVEVDAETFAAGRVTAVALCNSIGPK